MVGMKRFFHRIGLFGRLVVALVPMLIVVVVGLGIGGDEDLALIFRITAILVSLVVFFLLIRFIQGEDP
jgi:hypothetical protein